MCNKIFQFKPHIRGRSGVFMCKILENIKDKTAKELLEKYGVSPEPPVNLTKLLENAGISAKGIDFTEVENAAGYERGTILGAAISNGENLTVFYRKEDSENRKRFTIAHELAHCCLHSDNLKKNHIELRNSENKDSYREWAANIFAGELLIPEESLEKVYNDLLIPSLLTLAKIFGVSTNVMAARLDYLKKPYLKDAEYSFL